MIFRNAPIKSEVLHVAPAETAEETARQDENSEAERRRLAYERIARGGALAEAEADARRKWRGK